MSLTKIFLIPLAALWLSGCASNRQITVDFPKTDAQSLSPLPGQAVVSADDYYVQLVSEFEFKGDNSLKGGCSTLGSAYESSDLSAALVFNINNESLKFKREASGFLYQATSGKCNYKLETKRAYLTPWLRLDSAKDTQLEYSFLTSHSSETNLSQLVNDINTTSNLMMLTGVGTGIAVMGKLAGSWLDATAANQSVQNKPSANAQYSTETHTLAPAVSLGADGAKLLASRLPVYEIEEGGISLWGSEPKLLGNLKIYPELSASLLLKADSAGLPDAHDLSLDELMRTPIQTSAGQLPLQQVIDQTPEPEKPLLNPDWRDADQVDAQCRRLKLVLKGLGFNKFDRNAVLYYFLAQSADWRNYNITAQRAMTDAIRPQLLEKYRAKNFSACLAAEDYAVMKSLRLPVNTAEDWDLLTNNRQKKEGVIGMVQSAGRQLLAALNHPDKDEMTRQLYPLLFSATAGNGNVLLQNHLSNFGLEGLLQVPAISDEGLVVSAAQLSNVMLGLNIDSYSCVRPAQELGQPLPNIGIVLFLTKPGSPREKGGALEFELSANKITRLTFQHSTFRDFEQNLADYPDLGGCRIEADFLTKLH